MDPEKQVNHIFLNSIKHTFYDKIILRADEALIKEELPSITLYANNLIDIFGRIITRKIANITRNFVIRFSFKEIKKSSDVAYFFGVETKNLNKQMKRNANGFPEDFCFKLNSKEFKNLRFQNVTFNHTVGSRKYIPYVYTEEGVIALSGVIKSEIAAKMSCIGSKI